MTNSDPLFKRAYDTQERLVALHPEHELARKRYFHYDNEGYHLKTDLHFALNYQHGGVENGVAALVKELEAAIKKAQAAKIPTGH